jgi:hypothetical protein
MVVVLVVAMLVVGAIAAEGLINAHSASGGHAVVVGSHRFGIIKGVLHFVRSL